MDLNNNNYVENVKEKENLNEFKNYNLDANNIDIK